MGDTRIFPKALPSCVRPCPANDATAGKITLFTGVDHKYLSEALPVLDPPPAQRMSSAPSTILVTSPLEFRRPGSHPRPPRARLLLAQIVGTEAP
jgi:hypothetical protein